ncbi:MAG: hypothetical protein PHY93_21280 [Bacteriovorax sp.]|nr:hypothetical protein [Bacteriovorax sp.]
MEATLRMLDRINQRNNLLELAEMSGGKLLILDQYRDRGIGDNAFDQQDIGLRVDLGRGSVLGFSSRDNIDDENA